MGGMTAPFAAMLCGYRGNGNPNTSDNNDPGSIEWGYELFGELGVVPGTPEVARVGSVMEQRTVQHLQNLRPDLDTGSSRRALEFEQYAHLAVFRDFARAYRGPAEPFAAAVDHVASRIADASALRSLREAARLSDERAKKDHDLVLRLVDTMPEESLLKLDITIADRSSPPRMLIGLSAKWTLRTDRAQDCVSQGSKLVNLRRGQMPHFGVLTMEPRPAMLRLIAYGSGSVDCVYHLALPELRRAAATLEVRRSNKWKPRADLERMVSQGRLRDYDDLVAEVQRVR